MIILGITAFVHSSSAALLRDGEIVAAADEERFTRHKYTGVFPEHAIRFCLQQAGIRFAEVDHVAFYWDPWRAAGPRIANLLQSLPHSLAFFRHEEEPVQAIRGDFRAWRNMVGLPRILRRTFGENGRFRTHFIEHHLAHAASAYYPAPWDDALILSVDGTGEWTTTLLARGRGSRIEKLRDITHPHSLGVLYGAVTQFLGCRVYQDEWKIMGLAACGRPAFADSVRRLVRVEPDGDFRLNLDFFHFQYADRRTWYGPGFTDLFGPARRPEEPLDTPRFADIAASLQLVTEEALLALVRRLLERGGGCRNLCLAGGVALNAAANGRILREAGVDNLFVQPNAHDAGAALGAALYLHHAVLDGPRTSPLRHVYWGPEYDAARAEAALRSAGLAYETCPDIETRCAARLAAGKVVGWFQGRMEYGPRALGNRSILADPRQAGMKAVVNDRVKFREGFRPFAPSVAAEKASAYFADTRPCPYMTVVLPVRPEKRAVIPAVTHADGTARLQTVDEATNPRFHRLLREFEVLTGVPVLLNTSFNLQGEPIVCSPEDAVRTFRASGLDVLCLGDLWCEKQSS